MEGRGADRLVIGEIGGVIVVERGATFRYVPAGLHGLNGVDKMGGERWGIARSLGLVLWAVWTKRIASP